MKRFRIYGIILLVLFIACCLPHMDFTPNVPAGTDQGKTIAVASDKLIAHFIDVGQADSALLQLPNGQTMLIDAGGDVREYINSLSIQKIDYLIATHPHSDHIGYIEEIVRKFEIGEIYMPRVSHTSKTFEDLLLAIQEKGLKIKAARAGATALDTEDLDIVFVAPIQENYKDLNNYSAIVKVTYKDTSMLFTGDAEALSENQITADIDADVLKVGHHGSSTSTSKRFLDRVSPQIAVISCGEDNEYGHPHREVLQRLSSRNIEIYRTDESGTVVITSDGTNLSIATNRASAGTAAPDEDAYTEAEPSNTADVAVVYITRTSKRYHRDGCSGLSKSKIPSIFAEATAKGLTAFPTCNP